MQNVIDSHRVYDEADYTVQASAYPPDVVDAVARHLQSNYSLETPPAIGLIRHIIGDTKSGLQRFFSIKQQGGNSKKNTKLDEVVSMVTKIISRVKNASIATSVQEKTSYDGPTVHQQNECLVDPDMSMQTWLRSTLRYLTQHPYEESDDAKKWMTEIIAMIPTSDEKFTKIRGNFSTFLQECIEEEANTEDIIRGLLRAMNHEYLLKMGQFVSMQESGNVVEEPVSFDVHRIDEFQTPMGDIHSLMLSRRKKPEEFRSPCYEGGNDIVRIEPYKLLHEVGVMLVHTKSNQFRKDTVDDYRHRKADKEHACYIWDLFGNVADRSKMAFILLNKTLTPYQRWEKLSQYPICKAMYAATMAEEIRHGIDVRHHRKVVLESTDDEIGYRYLLRASFKQESNISQGFLSEPVTNEEEGIMLTKTMLEFTGKLTAISGGISPQLALAHIINTLESSRILTEVKSHTFRDELACASSKGPAKKSWEHAFAVKMIAAYLGNHFGLTDMKLSFDTTFNHLELVTTLKKILLMSPRELRRGVKEATDADFVIPVDCLPFAKIQPDGSLECPDATPCES